MDRQLVVACGLAVALTACGGGGGGSNTPAVAAPSITISFAQLKASIGVADVLTWSTTNATTCVGQDNLTGSQPLSGTSSITPTVGGQFKYTVSCTGAGGTTSGTALLMVPLPVLASSYQNSAIAGEVLGSQALPSEVAAGNAVAFADFFSRWYLLHGHPLAGVQPQQSCYIDNVWTHSFLAKNRGCLG